MKSIISVSPFRCRVWSLHDRLEGHITEETCRAEIDSFSRHGQLIPALGRPLHNDPRHDVELIYGARRLFVARHINVPLMVELRDLTDREAIVAMDIENRQRLDVSAYERGITYAQWLREGHFTSQDDISRALKVSATRISRLLKVGRLPSVIVNAFETPLDIREQWALDLSDALEEPRRRELTVQKARNIANARQRPSPREIYQQLLSTGIGRRPRLASHDEVVKNKQGQPIFRIRRQTSTLALLMRVENVSESTLTQIREALTEIFERDDARSARYSRLELARRIKHDRDSAARHTVREDCRST
jgi:ParB family chromosome partitioning protein